MAADTSWTKLPSILIVEIFNYLDLTDRLNASITCKQWRSCIFHPVLWPRVIFDVKSSNRKGGRFVANRCGQFARDVRVIFSSGLVTSVRDLLKISDILAKNRNIEKLVFQPTSCFVSWPEREPARNGEERLDLS